VKTGEDVPRSVTKPILPAAEPITPEAIDWLRDRRVGRRMPRKDAAALVRKMRDEWER
jgi:hypothetical protein